MKNHFVKKLFSLVLALAMVLGMLPSIAMEAKAATSTTISHSGYNLQLVEYKQTGQDRDVMSGLTSFRVKSFNKSGSECTVVMVVGNNIYTNMAMNVWDEFTFTFTDALCDEVLDTTVSTTKQYLTLEWYFKVTVRFTRGAKDHTGNATCVTPAICTSCGDYDINPNKHNPDDGWFWDNDSHYKTCGYGCDNRLSVGTCSYSTATCSAASVCSVCQHQKSGIVADAHNWGAWNSNGDGTHSRTCTLNGQHVESGNCSGGTASCKERAVCTTCGGQYGELKSHSTGSANDRPATCTAPAYCGVCGKEYGNALGHSTGKTGDIPANCTEPAYCSVCEESYGEPLGHSTDKAGDRLATHTTRAYCSVCQQEYGDVDPNAHVYSNGFCDCGAYEPAPDTDGDGIYEIGNGGQLYWFAQFVNDEDSDAEGELVANIVVNENVLKEDGSLNGDGSNFRVWTPIADYYSYFETFEGNGHTISGLYFNDSTVTKIGLFGVMNSSGRVQNLSLIDTYFCAKETVGGMVGRAANGATFVNCHNGATIVGEGYIGGIVGDSDKVTIENCYNTGTITGTVSNRRAAGGLIGYLYNGNVINSFSVGKVTYGDNVNGAIGAEWNGKATNSFCLGAATCDLDTTMTAEQFASGEVAYLLNGSTSEGDLIWGQTIGVQPHPVFGGDTVYPATATGCEAAKVYANTPGAEVEADHKIVDGVCSVCGGLFCDHSANENVDDSDCTTAFVCSVCNVVITEATAHTGGGGTATCVNGMICQTCGKEYGDVDENNHITYVYTVSQDGATCTASCDGCKKVLETATLVAPACKVYADGESYKISALLNGEPVNAEIAVTYHRWENDQWVKLEEASGNAGTYRAEAIVLENNEFDPDDDIILYVEYTIEKANFDLDTLTRPKVITNLVYNGQAHALVTAGAAESGNLVYSLAKDGEYTANIPTAIDAGDYTVWYYVVGDNNHKDSDKYLLNVPIGRASLADAVLTLTPTGTVYNGENQVPEITVTYNGVTLEEGKDYIYYFKRSADIMTMIDGKPAKFFGGPVEGDPVCIEADTYYAIVMGQGNYYSKNETTLFTDYTIGKAQLTVTADNNLMAIGHDLPSLTYTITGFVNGEDESVLTALPVISTAADGQSAGTFDITVSGAEAANYDFTYLSGELFVCDHSSNTNAATCLTKAVCSVCDTEFGEVDPDNHVYDGGVQFAPTCTEFGYTIYRCDCGDTYIADVVSSLGHSYDDGVITTNPTCTAEGVRTFTCTVCGTTREEVEPVVAHTHGEPIEVVVLKPTCTSTGIGQVLIHCTVCGVGVVNDVEIIPALQHTSDIDGDGKADNNDVILIMWHVLFPELYPVETCADLNHDNVLDNGDVVKLMWHILFPEEYPL